MAQNFRAPFLFGIGNTVGKFASRGSGTGRIAENVQVVNVEIFEKLAHLVKFQISFAGKTDHYIGADADLWYLLFNPVDKCGIIGAEITTIHFG
ncbi:MAG: hypothetical protein BWX60_00528 [Candidatus Marinimicrobia bacterium ADurb.Bin030]|nr:MAG: hypothetical protein BWX60_00528 [Candidatus Marinimicrobia bacterium ADurb.Bin030]